VLDANRLFERIEILALNILDQGDRQCRIVLNVAHHHRDFLEAGNLRRSPAPLASDDFVGVVNRTNQDRLQHPLSFD
jgi:hypothetical protein